MGYELGHEQDPPPGAGGGLWVGGREQVEQVGI